MIRRPPRSTRTDTLVPSPTRCLSAYGRGMATDDRDTLAEITSIDLLYAVLDRIVSEAGRSMASFIAADEAKLAIWRAQVAEVRSSLAQRQATGQAKVSAIMQIIEKTAMIENMLAASIDRKSTRLNSSH